MREFLGQQKRRQGETVLLKWDKQEVFSSFVSRFVVNNESIDRVAT